MPVSETSYFGLGYDLSLTQFTTTSYSPTIVTHHIADHGEDSLGITIKGSFSDDTRNRTIFAETGVLHSINSQLFLGIEGASHISALYNTETNIPYIWKTLGFDWYTVIQAKTRIAIGGDFLTAAQLNWILSPPPFLGEEVKNIRTTLFVDIGNVFEKVADFEYNELRASYGVEFNFLTPIGLSLIHI